MASLKTDVAKWLGLGISVIAIIVGAVVWAASSHDTLKEKSRIEIRDSEKSLKETMKDQYAPRHEFTKIEQKIDNQSQQIKDNSKKIDKIDSNIDNLDGKVDRLIQNMIRNNNRNNRNE